MRLASVIVVTLALSTVTHLAALYWGGKLALEADRAYRAAQLESPCPEPARAVFSKTVHVTSGTVTCRYYWVKP